MEPHDALRLFDERARVVLEQRGERPSQTAVARTLGIGRHSYNKALGGAQRHGSWSTLFAWLAAWRAAGMPELGILGTLSERWGGA